MLAPWEIEEMSDIKDTEEVSENPTGKKTISLRQTVDTSHVKQNFSHGRSRSVLVEKKRKRTVGGPSATPKASVEAEEPKAAPIVEKPQAQPVVAARAAKPNAALRNLTSGEQDARAQALADARVRETEDLKRAAEDTKKRVAEEAERKIAEEASRLEAEQKEASRLKAEAESRRPASTDTKPNETRNAQTDAPGRRKKNRPAEEKATPSRKSDSQRRRGKLTITNALDDAPRQRSLASIRRQREREKKQAGMRGDTQAKISHEVIIPEVITVQELANRMAERSVDVIKYLMKEGQMLKADDVIDTDTAELIVEEFGHTAKRVSEADVEAGLLGGDDNSQDLQPRAPIVTVMGHVDHGKTSLLDAIRNAKVTSGEAGGITQHIGAYQVELAGGQKVTFIDTPGHAAFTAMRARGAEVTDLVILVVAADDGVMPQTVEAINHAKAAEVPMIIAINKIDKTGADANRVRNELLQHEIVSESLGGDVLEVEVSATENTNLDKLLEVVLLQAELLELQANPDRPADGVVIEAKLDRGRGPVGTMLVQRGTLKIGDIVVAGAEWGKVRALINDNGQKVDEAGPSVPVEVLGLNGTPEAGDQFGVVETEARAREITEYRQRKRRDARGGSSSERASLEHMMDQLKEAAINEFPIVIKADVQGSVEAIIGALDKLGTDEVRANIVHSGVGGITESDIALATASRAVVMGFNVRANTQAREGSDRENIEIRYYNVIYDLVDDVKAVMSGMLPPTLREDFLGNAEVLEVFNISKVGKIAGCRITDGMVKRGSSVRLIRDNVVIHEGKLSTLKRFKDEVKEVNAGQECGMAFEKYEDLKAADIIECFDVVEIIRTL